MRVLNEKIREASWQEGGARSSPLLDRRDALLLLDALLDTLDGVGGFDVDLNLLRVRLVYARLAAIVENSNKVSEQSRTTGTLRHRLLFALRQQSVIYAHVDQSKISQL